MWGTTTDQIADAIAIGDNGAKANGSPNIRLRNNKIKDERLVQVFEIKLTRRELPI